MEKTKVMMCPPAKECVFPVVGSKVSRCEKCNVEVRIAPTGLAMVEAGDTMIYCIPCGLKSVEETGGEIAPPTPEQLEELRKQQIIDQQALEGN